METIPHTGVGCVAAASALRSEQLIHRFLSANECFPQPTLLLMRTSTLLLRNLRPSTQTPIPSTIHRQIRTMVKPAARVASQRKDVWSIVNEAAAGAAAAGTSVINLGQGFLYDTYPSFSFSAPLRVSLTTSVVSRCIQWLQPSSVCPRSCKASVRPRRMQPIFPDPRPAPPA
jgi:hypothetical protein